MTAKADKKPTANVSKKRVPSDKKELKAILKTLKEMRHILDGMWNERRPGT